MPVAPLLLLCATPGVLAISDALHLRWAWLPRFALPLALVVLEAHVSENIVKLRGNSRADLAGLAEVLRCTDRDDYVMDAKCGAIFRQRPFYYALEDVTEKRIARGLIKDDIVERLIATHTCAARTTRLGDRALHFVKANYLIQGVGYGFAGQFLHPDEQGRSHFEIQIVTTYTILTPQGQATGELDGKAFTGKVLLAAGWHEFVSPQPCGSLAIVWSQAVERGFKPNFLPGLSATETGEE